MTIQQWLAIAGAFCGSLGSILTAFSLNAVVRELNFARQFQEITQEALAGRGPVPIFTGLDQRMAAAQATANRYLWPGVLLLAAGFILQAIATYWGAPAGPAGR